MGSAGRLRVGILLGIVLATITLAAPWANVAQAAPGNLDRGYGKHGIVDVTPAPPSAGAGYSTPEAMAIGPHGEAFIVDNARRNCNASGSCNPMGELRVAKYLANGRLDSTFSPVVSIGARSAEIAVDQKGRVVVAAADSNADLDVFRFLSNGELDPGFGTEGRVTLAGTGELSLSDLAIAPDGDLVLSASMRSSFAYSSDVMAVAFRLTAVGAPDPEFGGFAGISAFDTSEADFAGEAAVVHGQIVMAATTQRPCCEPPERRLIRFARTGRVIGPIYPPVSEDPLGYLGPILAKADGGAWVFSSSGSSLTATAYRRDWRRDSRVGRRGSIHILRFALRSYLSNGPATAAVDAVGRLVVAGVAQSRPPDGCGRSRVAVFRRRPHGRVDQTFHRGRPVCIQVPEDRGKTDANVALGIQSDGGILVLVESSYLCVRSCKGAPGYFLVRIQGGSVRPR
jgi:uncharacterized delta-60 repeat protein